jgi:preprotein translocase SecE subunit
MQVRSEGKASLRSKSKDIAGGSSGFMGVIKDTVDELKKVHAPTKQETLQATLVTLAIVIFFAVILALLDWAFRGLVWRLV